MRDFTLIGLLCLVFFSLTAQSRWSYGIELAVGTSGRDAGEEVQSTGPDFNLRSGWGETLQPSLGAGLWVSYRPATRLRLRSGVQYRGLNGHYFNYFIDEGPTAPRSNSNRSDTYIYLHGLQAPTQVTFDVLHGHLLTPYIGLGVTPRWIIGGNYVEKYQGGGNEGRSEIAGQLETERIHTRWSFPFQMDVGLRMGRFDLSLTRIWEGRFVYENRYLMWCGVGPLPNIHFPGFENRMLRQTSLRLQYRLSGQ